MYASKLDSGSESEEFPEYSSDEDIDVSYVTGHNQGKGDVMARFKELEARRKAEEAEYDARQISDGSWKSVLENPMNISSQMGNVIGKDMKALNGPRRKNNIKKGMVEAYKQLIYNNDEEK